MKSNATPAPITDIELPDNIDQFIVRGLLADGTLILLHSGHNPGETNQYTFFTLYRGKADTLSYPLPYTGYVRFYPQSNGKILITQQHTNTHKHGIYDILECDINKPSLTTLFSHYTGSHLRKVILLSDATLLTVDYDARSRCLSMTRWDLKNKQLLAKKKWPHADAGTRLGWQGDIIALTDQNKQYLAYLQPTETEINNQRRLSLLDANTFEEKGAFQMTDPRDYQYGNGYYHIESFSKVNEEEFVTYGRMSSYSHADYRERNFLIKKNWHISQLLPTKTTLIPHGGMGIFISGNLTVCMSPEHNRSIIDGDPSLYNEGKISIYKDSSTEYGKAVDYGYTEFSTRGVTRYLKSFAEGQLARIGSGENEKKNEFYGHLYDYRILSCLSQLKYELLPNTLSTMPKELIHLILGYLAPDAWIKLTQPVPIENKPVAVVSPPAEKPTENTLPLPAPTPPSFTAVSPTNKKFKKMLGGFLLFSTLAIITVFSAGIATLGVLAAILILTYAPVLGLLLGYSHDRFTIARSQAQPRSTTTTLLSATPSNRKIAVQPNTQQNNIRSCYFWSRRDHAVLSENTPHPALNNKTTLSLPSPTRGEGTGLLVKATVL